MSAFGDIEGSIPCTVYGYVIDDDIVGTIRDPDPVLVGIPDPDSPQNNVMGPFLS